MDFSAAGLSVCLIAVYSVHAHILEKMCFALVILVGSICSYEVQVIAYQSISLYILLSTRHISLQARGIEKLLQYLTQIPFHNISTHFSHFGYIFFIWLYPQ